MMARYVARESGDAGTWWVEDTEMLTHLDDRRPHSQRTEVAATFWGWVHPNPERAAKDEADRLNEVDDWIRKAEG